MVVCDNCGTGQECDSWADVMDFMREEGWKKKFVAGEWKHFCPECQENEQKNKILEQAREALKYCKVSVCRPAEGVADVTIAEINNALNSTKQSVSDASEQTENTDYGFGHDFSYPVIERRVEKDGK